MPDIVLSLLVIALGLGLVVEAALLRWRGQRTLGRTLGSIALALAGLYLLWVGPNLAVSYDTGEDTPNGSMSRPARLVTSPEPAP